MEVRHFTPVPIFFSQNINKILLKFTRPKVKHNTRFLLDQSHSIGPLSPICPRIVLFDFSRVQFEY